MSLHPVTSHAEGVPTLDVLGISARILLDGKQTHGAFALVELTGRPGDLLLPSIHHREELTYHVVEGEMEIDCGGHRAVLRAGDTFFAPRHAAQVPRFAGTRPSRVLLTVTPAGFERCFRELDERAGQGEVSPEAARTLLVERYGCEFPPDRRAG